MVSPPFLKPGDKIGIVSPSGRIKRGKLARAIEIFNEWGLKVITGEHVYAEHNQFGGTDSQRASDIQEMLDDDQIKAIICSRGGYGTVRIIDRLNFSHFISKPKWVIGYSDITVLHNHINHCFDIETIHAPMPAEFSPEAKSPLSTDSVNLFKEVLFGKLPQYKLPGHPLSRAGKATGLLAGGNLSVLYSLQGSPSGLDARGKILFIEDVGEYLYHIDRMIMALKRNGTLDVIGGLVVGGMTDMNDNPVPFGKTAEEIISESVEEFGYPVCFGFPAGHQPDNSPLILGRRVLLNVGEKTNSLEYISYTAKT